MTQPNQQPEPLPIEPGHVMPIEKFERVKHHERLAREAAEQK